MKRNRFFILALTAIIIFLNQVVNATTGVFPNTNTWWGHERANCTTSSSQYDGYWIQATIPTFYTRYAYDGINNSNRVNVDSWFVYNSTSNTKSWVEWAVSRGDDDGTKVEWLVNYNYSTGDIDGGTIYYISDLGYNEFNTGENHTMGCVYNSVNRTIEMRSDNAIVYSFGSQDYSDIYLGYNREVDAGLELHRNTSASGWNIISKPWEIYNCNTRVNGIWNLWKNLGGITIEDEISNSTSVSFDSVNNKIKYQ